MIPPIIRRLFSSSPIVAPLLLILAITTLFLGIHPRTRSHVVPNAWVGGSGVGGPVGAGAGIGLEQEKEVEQEKVYDHDAPLEPHTIVVAPPPSDIDDRLPPAYAKLFKGRVLPEDLESIPSVSTKLEQWLRRPILSHEDARESNTAHCPYALANKLVNPDQLRDQKTFWETEVTAAEVAVRRAEIVKYIARKAWEGADIVGKAGPRGIVMTAGNKDTLARAVAVLRVLRKFEVDLPVQIFHYKGEAFEYIPRGHVKELQGELIEIKGVTQTPGAWKNWQIKGLALIQSSFSEILYLDSDNMPLRSPLHLFDDENYLKGGQAAFWPDMTKDHPSNAIWRIVGESCTLNEWTFESGQFVISKAGNDGLNLAALHVAAGMMDEDSRDFWFKLAGGDKDTFRWAFRILDIPYVAAPRWMSALGFSDGEKFCGHTTLQYDLTTPAGHASPPPLFVHSNVLKHLAWRDKEKKLFAQVKRLSNDAATEPSLNKAHYTVTEGGARNMCIDLESDDEGNKVVVEAVEDIPGEPFKGFEELFFESGGIAGGW